MTWISSSLCGLGGVIGLNYVEIFGSSSLGAGLGAGVGGFLASIIHTSHIRRNYRDILLGKNGDGGDEQHA